jgi:deoxyribose-phosphate aldolase
MNPVQELAKMIDHSLLHPTITDEGLKEGCKTARRYGVASVCVKPYAVRQAADLLKRSDVLVCAVVGFPHGNSSVEVKVAETGQVCRDGAREADMVVNIGKVLGGDWSYVEGEIQSVLDACHAHGAILKVIFENDFLPEDRFKIRLCEICSRLETEFVKTSTGYGFVQGPDGKYSYKGATDDDLRLMRKHCAPSVRLKAAGGIRTLDDLMRVKALGATRIGASATAAILDEAKARFGNQETSLISGTLKTPGN